VGDTVVLGDGTRCRIESIKPDGRYGCITEDFKRAFDAAAGELGHPTAGRRRRRRGEPGEEHPQAPDQSQGGAVATPGVETDVPESTAPVLPGQTDDPRFTARGGPVESPQASGAGKAPTDPAHREAPKVALPTPEALARAQQEEAQREKFRNEEKGEGASPKPAGQAEQSGQPPQPTGTGTPSGGPQAEDQTKESPKKEDDKWQPPSKGQPRRK
jgi:hypothetical protein